MPLREELVAPQPPLSRFTAQNDRCLEFAHVTMSRKFCGVTVDRHGDDGLHAGVVLLDELQRAEHAVLRGVVLELGGLDVDRLGGVVRSQP
jgi:hypothetical protein